MLRLAAFLKSKVAKKKEVSNEADLQKRLSEASVKLLGAELESTLAQALVSWRLNMCRSCDRGCVRVVYLEISCTLLKKDEKGG